MPRPRVYVETTIPSFYHELRTDPDVVARRQWTQQWWHDAASRCELVTSVAVLDELGAGDPGASATRLALVRDLPVLAVDVAVAEIVATYIRHR